jgi:hypothetical protein
LFYGAAENLSETKTIDETEYLLPSPVNAGKLRQVISKSLSGEDPGTRLNMDDLWK